MNDNPPQGTDWDQDITILVPTCKRPRMLRSCLQSIDLQSRKERIKVVMVSENSNDEASRSVVEEFQDRLPIQYIQQTRGLTAQEHGIWLSQRVETRYVALIADDDMWSRYHLEEAMRCFDKHPSICAFFGQVIVVENESCCPFGKYSSSFLQMQDPESDGLVDFRTWDPADAAVNCLVTTPINIWALVARADAHLEAMTTSTGDPIFGPYPSNDRLYIWRLSLQGKIGIGRNISLFYRRHPQSEIHTWLRDRQEEFFATDLAISQEIARQAGLLGLDAYSAWHEQYKAAIESGLPAERIEMWNPKIKAWLLGDPPTAATESKAAMEPTPIERLRRVGHLLLPPAIQIAARRLKKKLAQA